MNLSSEYGVSKQQISDISKNKDKIMKFANKLESDHGLKRKSLKAAHDEQLDKALYTWFIQQTKLLYSTYTASKNDGISDT